jgi:hypothetical protein
VTDFKTSQFAFQPVIIIGAARSGTNMLRDALTRLDGVATWPCDEINAIWRYHHCAFPSDELPAHEATSDVRHYVRAAFRSLADRTRARWIVEKTCANSLRVDFVKSVMPECKFVFLVRDGRAVVASAMKRWQAGLDVRYILRKACAVPLPDVPFYAVRFARHRLYRALSRDRRLPSWGPRFAGIDRWVATRSLAEVCAQQWSECVLKAAAAFARVPSSTFCAVRYETLVASPTQELARIASFLEIPTCAEQLSRLAQGVTDQGVAKWRTDSCAEAVVSIEPLVEATWKRLSEILPHWADAAEIAA